MRRALLTLAIACAACSNNDPSDDDDLPDATTGGKDARPPGEDAGGSADAADAGGAGADTGEDAGPPVDARPTDFAALTDEFEGGSLDDKWSVHRPEVGDVRVESGQLVVTMTEEALWFQDQEAILVYQNVTGDFAVEGAVYARSTASPGSAPNRMVHLGGIMARNGSSDAENYVFAVVGHDEVDLSVETKSTTNSVSDFSGPNWPDGDAELRLCRTGAEFRLFKRRVGASAWELAATESRPDLPATLQVGANAYAFGASPDLTVRFDVLRFSGTCD